jgi:TRAP-type mannitol/chloroaromatic compound transport system substrate-binding protein
VIKEGVQWKIGELKTSKTRIREDKMKLRKKSCLMVAVFIIVVFIITPAFAQKTIKWKAQGFWGAGTLGHKCFADFCSKVKVLTGGRLEIKAFPGGAIVPYNELFDQVRNNVLQGMYTWPGWWSGTNPAFSALGDLIAGWHDPHDLMTFYYNEGALQFLEKLYEPYGLYPVGVVMAPVESLVSKKPIYKIEDFKGLKIRSPEGMEGDFFRKLGASIVVLPGGEVYSALDKGVVDAGDWSSPALNKASGLDQVAKYFFYPGWHSLPQNDFTVKKTEWEKLPDDIKAILKTAVREWADDFILKSRIADIEAVAEMKKKGNVPIDLSDEEMAKIRKVAEETWDEWATKSPDCKKAIEMQKNFMRKLGQL